MRSVGLGLFLCFCCFCLGCGGSGVFHPATAEQALPSGKRILVTSCLLVWGVEHDERHREQDSFALEYVSPVLASSPAELEQEALEVFELIRPISEQWGFVTASVTAFPEVERTGPYEIFVFSRSASGAWSHARRSAKVFNTPSGRKE